MAAAPRYNAWQYSRIAPWVGRRVLEVGSGIGNMSAHIAATPREFLILTDMDEFYRERLRQRFAGQGVQVEALALPDPAAPGRFVSQRLDTIVALNVVEHIEDHLGALRTMHEMLVPGGRVIILVPALPSIYGTLDTELQHFRRYTRATLAAVIADAGFRLEHLSWFNRVGVFGWWLNARVRKVPRIPLAHLRMFDAVVPLLTAERFVPLPFGQSLVAVGRRDG